MTPTREQLASIEWAGPLLQGREIVFPPGAIARVPIQTCPVCHRERGSGHAEWCWLAACLAAPPPEPQAMPPIEVGDWIVGKDSVKAARVMDIDDVWSWEECADLITEIRKANGTVWTREPRR